MMLMYLVWDFSEDNVFSSEIMFKEVFKNIPLSVVNMKDAHKMVVENNIKYFNKDYKGYIEE